MKKAFFLEDILLNIFNKYFFGKYLFINFFLFFIKSLFYIRKLLAKWFIVIPKYNDKMHNRVHNFQLYLLFYLLERKRSWRAWAAWQRRAHVSAAASPVPRRARTSPATTANPGPPVTSVGILYTRKCF